MALAKHTPLYRTLSDIDNSVLMKAFLVDLFTPDEMLELETRWQIVQRLAQHESQRSIAKDLGVGIATVTRGARELYDKKGGFWRVLEKTTKL